MQSSEESRRARPVAEHTARALYFESPGRVRVRREPITVLPGEHLVRSSLIGISHGTESLFYKGPFPTGHLLESNARVGESAGYPIKYGYMNVGLRQDGERVFAFVPHQDLFAARPEETIAVPDDVTDDDAVLYPSVETAVQICHDASPVLGERVLLFGLGVIGQCVARILRHQGVQVVALDPVSARRERAIAAGCVAIDPTAPDCRDRVYDLTAGRGADIAINVSARGQALQLGLDLLAMEGTLVEASWYGENAVSLQLGTAFHRRRLTLRSSQVSRLAPMLRPRWDHRRRTELAWEMVRRIEPRGLITHRIALDDAALAYELIATGAEDVLQVVLTP